MNDIPTEQGVIDCIKTVFDPEFPLVDIWTMGLIYQITINREQRTGNREQMIGDSNQEDVTPNSELRTPNFVEGERDDEGFVSYDHQGQIVIDMTLTTPACPAADYLPAAAKNVVQSMYPDYEVILNLIRDPTWTVAMIKDEDLKRMFE